MKNTWWNTIIKCLTLKWKHWGWRCKVNHYQLQWIYNGDARQHGIIKTYIPQVALAMHYYPSTTLLNFVFDPELQAGGEVGRKERGEEK